MASNTLYLIGGTGGLGGQVAKGLVTAGGFESRKALVRDLTKGKALQDLGWNLVQVSDFTDVAEMTAALKDASVVVSTTGGGDIAAVETAAIQAAKAAGASLFVPSQFGVDYRRWGTEFPFLAGKKSVVDFADSNGLPTLKVFTGMFSDWIFDFITDPVNATATLIDGSVDTKVSWTKRSDIGFVLAKALEDPEYKTNGGFLSMAGDTMSYKDAYAIFEKALGKKLTIETIPAKDALEQEQELLKKGLEGDVGAFYGSFKLHLLGEPSRGNDGSDTSGEAKTYGVSLTKLEDALKEKYS